MFKMLMLHLLLTLKSPWGFQILFETKYWVPMVTVKVSEIIEKNLNWNSVSSKGVRPWVQRPQEFSNLLELNNNLRIKGGVVEVGTFQYSWEPLRMIFINKAIGCL